MQHKYDVHLTIATDGDLGLTLNCNRMFKGQIEKYIYDIADKNKVPQESCVYRVGASFNDITSIHTHISHDSEQTADSVETSMGALDINVLRKNDCKCSKYQCLYNLASGKCNDPFMIDIIGKKFFPDKYKTIKTKQR